MLTAYLVLLCEFFWEFSIFHFCSPLFDIYWHLPLIRHCHLWLFLKKWWWFQYWELLRDQRRETPTHAHEKKTKQNKDTWLKMARLSPFVPFGLVLAFQAWLWPFWPVFGLFDTLYNLTICEKDVICVQSSNCQHDLQESLQKLSDFIVWGEVPCHIS